MENVVRKESVKNDSVITSDDAKKIIDKIDEARDKIHNVQKQIVEKEIAEKNEIRAENSTKEVLSSENPSSEGVSDKSIQKTTADEFTSSCKEIMPSENNVLAECKQ